MQSRMTIHEKWYDVLSLVACWLFRQAGSPCLEMFKVKLRLIGKSACVFPKEEILVLYIDYLVASWKQGFTLEPHH
jgi:hypothetical protein